MPEEVKDKKIAYRASEEFRRRLQIAAIERGMKVQGLIDDALEKYLAEEGSEAQSRGRETGPLGALAAGERKFLAEMLDFYRAADAASIKLVRQHAAAIKELSAAKGSMRRTG